VRDIVKTKNPCPTWEAQLIERASAGDKVAFESIVDLYRPALYNIAKRMLRNSEDANDAVQETFIKALRSLPDFDSKRPIKPWLSRICSNCCVDILRERKRNADSLTPYEFKLEGREMGLAEHAENALTRDHVMTALKRLPRKYRDILLMRHYNDMDVMEIATALNAPEGTVKSWLFRARALLKQSLATANAI
jgi:RNA polymerase sigma-70 factor (ECF subfamily)